MNPVNNDKTVIINTKSDKTGIKKGVKEIQQNLNPPPLQIPLKLLTKINLKIIFKNIQSFLTQIIWQISTLRSDRATPQPSSAKKCKRKLINHINNILKSDTFAVQKRIDKQRHKRRDYKYDGWITVKRGEAVLNPAQTEKFQKLVSNMNPFVDTMRSITSPNSAGYSGKSSCFQQTAGDINLNLELNNVTDTDSFIRQLQTEPKIRKAVSQAVLDPVTGKGLLNISRLN